MAFDITIRPFPLGQIKVPVPGTPVNLMANFPGGTGNANNVGDLFANKIEISAITKPTANTGSVYFGLKNMNKTTGAGVIKVLSPGQAWTITNPVGGSSYHVGDYWVDADVANEGVYASADPS